MSTNLNYKQVANVTRRTWDVEAYERRAKERAKNDTNGGNVVNGNHGPGVGPVITSVDGTDAEKPEFVPAPKGSGVRLLADRAYLKARKSKVDGLDSKVGSVEVINPDAVATSKSVAVGDRDIDQSKAVIKSGVGWHCKVCDCFLKDSLTYLDHINGRKHQRALGFSMRVERSTTDQVADRLAQLAQKQKQSTSTTKNQWTIKDINDDDVHGDASKGLSKKEGDDGDDEEDIYNALVKSKDEELRRKKEERKRERKERKKLKKLQQQQGDCEVDDDEDEKGNELKKVENLEIQPETDASKSQGEGEGGGGDEEDEEEGDDGGGIDPDLAAVMGFSGFGGGNKNP